MNVNFGYLEQKLSRELHPENQKKAKPKTIDSQTRPEDILDMFQNQNLAPAEWENLAEQVLKRGSKKSRTTSEGMSSQYPKGTQYLSLVRGF